MGMLFLLEALVRAYLLLLSMRTFLAFLRTHLAVGILSSTLATKLDIWTCDISGMSLYRMGLTKCCWRKSRNEDMRGSCCAFDETKQSPCQVLA